jgi:hypothetical protein
MVQESTQTNVSAPETKAPTPVNATLLQAFEWYTEAGGKHISNLVNVLDDLARMGITAMWIPRTIVSMDLMKERLIRLSLLQGVFTRRQWVKSGSRP